MTGMHTITATEFKAKCLDILDHVPSDGIEITKRGKPVAKLMPISNLWANTFGSVPDLVVNGDIFSTGLKWDAES